MKGWIEDHWARVFICWPRGHTWLRLTKVCWMCGKKMPADG